MKKALAWHFLQSDKKLRYAPHTKIRTGQTVTCDPDKLDLCAYGLHASVKPIDALSFVSWENAIICRVELSGKILESSDKLCASSRKVLWMAKADTVLHEFSCWCAEQVLPIYEKHYPNDNRCRKAIEAKRLWMKGKISDQELAAARAAARDAAWAAARAAARDAARAAARDAAWDAARAAAWDAAWDAARDAAWDAAWDAARDAQNKQLESMFLALGPKKKTLRKRGKR